MSDPRRANRHLLWQLLAMAAGSFGFGFALVPLYNVLCSVTGYGDQAKLLERVQAVEHPDVNRTVKVEFLADIASAATGSSARGAHPRRASGPALHRAVLRAQPQRA